METLGQLEPLRFPKSEKQLKQRKPELCGFFVGLSRSSRETFSTLGFSKRWIFGWQRIIPDRLLRSQHVYSIHSHHRVVAKVKSHRADVVADPDPRPMMDAFVSWASGLVGLGSKDEILPSFVGIKMIKISHYIYKNPL